ncbi:hypothetical protein LINPERHAP1_LOCUS24230 [Linum perenne]
MGQFCINLIELLLGGLFEAATAGLWEPLWLTSARAPLLVRNYEEQF